MACGTSKDRFVVFSILMGSRFISSTLIVLANVLLDVGSLACDWLRAYGTMAGAEREALHS
jgi:hypothetical protein